MHIEVSKIVRAITVGSTNNICKNDEKYKKGFSHKFLL